MIHETTFEFERDMRPIVASWLSAQVEYVQFESWAMNPTCDLLGFSFRPDAVQHRIQMRQRTPLSMKQWGQIRPWMPLYAKIVAVEMKLAKMSEVLFQAQCHYPEVTESWVAMPEPYASRIAPRCEGQGIGVLSVGGRCEVVLAAKVHSPSNHNWNDHRIAEVFWRKYGKAVKK